MGAHEGDCSVIKRTPAVMVVTHSHGHDDGCMPILRHLAEKYTLGMISGVRQFVIARRIAQDKARKRPETIVIEAGYPFTSADIAAMAKVPPVAVSLVLLLVDPVVFELDPTGAGMRNIVFV